MTVATSDASISDAPVAAETGGAASDGPRDGGAVDVFADAPISDGALTPEVPTISDAAATCPGTELQSCAGQCVDLRSSPNHCGACGSVCGAFQTCTAGRCSPAFKSAVNTGTVPGSLKDVTVGADGSLLLAGVFKGTVDFDPGPTVEMATALGAEDIFVSKFRPDGSHAWTRAIRSSGDEPDVGVVAGADGSAVVFGSHKGSTEFFAGQQNTSRTSQTAFQEAFVMKLTSDGALAFLRTFGSPNAGYSTIWGADVAPDGSIVVAGPFGGPIDVGSGAQHAGVSGGYAVRLSATGAPNWLQTFVAKDAPANSVTNAQVPCRGGAGSVWIAGTFSGKLDFDASAPALEGVSGTRQSAYAVRVSAGGALMGGVTIPADAMNLYVGDCAESAGGALYLTGSFHGGTFPHGSQAPFSPRANAGNADGWLAKVTADLKYEWGTVLGGAGWDVGSSLAPLSDSTVVILGSFSSASLDFNPVGPPDVKQGTAGLLFATRLAADGSYRGTFTLGPGASPMHVRTTSDGFSLTGVLNRAVDLDPHPTAREERTPSGQAIFVSQYRL